MIVFQSNTAADSPTRIILVFGVGLIGTSLYEAVVRTGAFTARHINYAWENSGCAGEDAKRLEYFLKQTLASETQSTPLLSVVWSAGRAGFSAGLDETAQELAAFEGVLSLVKNLLAICDSMRCFFHLLSSAGGLFEGAGTVQPRATPMPMRHYGKLKLAQEQCLLQCDIPLVTHIYRPTSVYGYHGSSTRMGLISALVLNGVRNRVSTIYGTMHTLRDYVFNHDIGEYVTRLLFTGTVQDKPVVHYLATGKPSSIYEIQQIVEKMLGRKLLLQFQSDADFENVSDISVNPVLLPQGWAPVDVRTGIGYLTERIVAEKGRVNFF